MKKKKKKPKKPKKQRGQVRQVVVQKQFCILCNRQISQQTGGATTYSHPKRTGDMIKDIVDNAAFDKKAEKHSMWMTQVCNLCVAALIRAAIVVQQQQKKLKKKGKVAPGINKIAF